MKTLQTTEELRDFTLDRLKKSGLSMSEIAERLGISTKYVDHAISKGQRSNSARNGLRCKLLSALGYEVLPVFNVNKIRNK